MSEDRNKSSWFALDVGIESSAREAIEYGLMEANALGTETLEDGGSVTIRGYFKDRPEIESIKSGLLDALRIYSLNPSVLFEFKIAEVADRDWLAEWKKSWQPIQIGRFIIAPPWVSVPGGVATGSTSTMVSLDPAAIPTSRDPDTIVIRINPGMAFGTGTHETTRLCLKAIEKHYRGGSFLDVGTGTGILAIAAAKTHQQPEREAGRPLIVACDVDADAVAIAQENAELNGVADRINFRVGSVDDKTESADFVCANLTAPVIVDLLPNLVGATCGRLVLSGILDLQIDMVKARLLELGVVDFGIDQDGEWVALTI